MWMKRTDSILGKTYSNSCGAQCARIEVQCDGECPCTDCVCPLLLDPVCGTNNQTISNSCLAECEGTEVQCQGECPCPDCVCIEIYQPVCGSDGEISIICLIWTTANSLFRQDIFKLLFRWAVFEDRGSVWGRMSLSIRTLNFLVKI